MTTLTGPRASIVSAKGETREGETSILLFAAQPFVTEVAEVLRREITACIKIVETHTLCMEALRRETFDLVVLEESVAALDPVTAGALYDAAGTSVAIEVNFGLMQAGRIVLAARSALHRRKLDLQQARAAARIALEQRFTTSLTGLLLESQLALRQVGPGQVPALERLVGLAEHVCAHLRGDDHRPL